MNSSRYDRRYESLRVMVDRRLAVLVRRGEPRDLREASRYVLSAGGKRVRAVLTLLCCELVGGTARGALDAAAAMEILHNFTLVHDDVMDNAGERRGRATVHLRWDLNTAILTGDVLVGFGYRSVLGSDRRRALVVARVYTEGLIDVCEGQALDLALGKRSAVVPSDYFRMIGKKTGALLAASAEMGGILGGATPRQCAALRRFGYQLGIAFQLQDDLLDVVADPRELGKPVGGDILERKRTYLLLRAAQLATGGDAAFLSRLMSPESPLPKAKGAQQRLIEQTTAIYRRTGVLDEAQQQVRRATATALRALSALPAGKPREMLGWLAERLVHRAF